jgi:predicted DNA-binding transcriptional regulator YafY
MIEQLTRLRDTHKLMINEGLVSTEIAKRLNVSKSQTEKDIRFLRDIGLEASFCLYRQCYVIKHGHNFWELIKDRVG